MQDPSGSYDEEAFIAEAGFSSDSGDAMPETRGPKVGERARAGPNVIERALTAFYRATGVGWIADKLKGNVAVCAVSWFFLIVGGVAHLCRHMGMESSVTAVSIETAATVAVYALAGTSEFVDVSYELAVGNVNIHVLTTLAAAGTVLLGCAIEGAMLLVLFVSAHFVETRLAGHARGDCGCSGRRCPERRRSWSCARTGPRTRRASGWSRRGTSESARTCSSEPDSR